MLELDGAPKIFGSVNSIVLFLVLFEEFGVQVRWVGLSIESPTTSTGIESPSDDCSPFRTSSTETSLK